MTTTMTTLQEAAELESKLAKHEAKCETARMTMLERQADALEKLEAKHKADRAAIVSVYSREAGELLDRMAAAKKEAPRE